MAERVQIEIEATDAASGILRGITSQFGALGNTFSDFANMVKSNSNFMGLYSRAMKDGSVSAGELEAAQNAASAATGRFYEALAMLVVNGLKESINATMEYASQVRDLSLASGASAEESSRLIQVLDDYEITANDITAATRRLTKNGLEPNMETIAKLADEYVAIQDPIQKNAFLMENFGRAGMGWANALSQGGDKLRALSNDINANLILNEKQIQQTEQYRLAVDELTDTWDGLKVKVGTEVIPVLSDLLLAVSKNIEAGYSWRDVVPAVALYDWAVDLKEAHEELNPEIDSATQSYMAMAKAAEKDAKAQEELAKQVEAANEEITKQNESMLAMQERLTGASGQQVAGMAYEQFKAAMMADGTLLDEEKARIDSVGLALGTVDELAIDAAAAMDRLRQDLESGKISEEDYVKQTQAIVAAFDARAAAADNARTPLAELVTMAERLNDATEEQIKQTAYQDLKSKLSEGGITDEEAAILERAGVALGIFDQNALNASQNIDKVNEAFGRGLIDLETYAGLIEQISAGIQVINDESLGLTEAVDTSIGSSGTEGTFGNATGTSGQWVTVPPGYPNDSYRMGLSSGEKYMVQTGAEAGGDTVNNTSAVNNYYGNITMVVEGSAGFSETRV
jgi:hypothetical protein